MSYVVDMVQDRVLKRNKNWLAAFCGATGSGKSYASISIAAAVDPSFTVKNRLVFTAKQFMALLNSGTLEKGCAVIFDEAGVGIPARDWYSVQNKLISYIMQTFRTDNLAVLFTMPSFDFIDVNARKLFHHYFETMAIDYGRRKARLKLQEISYNPLVGKLYRKYLRTPRGLLKFVYVKKPKVTECREYDLLRDRYSHQLKRETEKELNPQEKKEFDILQCPMCKIRAMYAFDGRRSEQ